MIIAVTTSGEGLTASLDPRLGRAPQFLVFNTQDDSISMVENAKDLGTAQGAGLQSAQNLARTGAEAVITGNCGPKAHKALSAAGIKIYRSDAATAGQALELWKAGKLELLAAANVEAHWI